MRGLGLTLQLGFESLYGVCRGDLRQHLRGGLAQRIRIHTVGQAHQQRLGLRLLLVVQLSSQTIEHGVDRPYLPSAHSASDSGLAQHRVRSQLTGAVQRAGSFTFGQVLIDRQPRRSGRTDGSLRGVHGISFGQQ